MSKDTVEQIRADLAGGYLDTFQGCHETIKGLLYRLEATQKRERELEKKLESKRDEALNSAHVLIQSGFIPGISSHCRCDQCKSTCIAMENAGYLDSVRDKWWETEETKE